MTFDDAKIAAENGNKIRHRTWKTIKYICKGKSAIWTVKTTDTEMCVPENIFDILYLRNTPLDGGWDIVEEKVLK